MIINTRPIDLGRKLNVLLQKYKCSFTHIPLTKVIKIQPSEKAKHYISHSSKYDLLIFTSQSSVLYGAEYSKEILLKNNQASILSIGLATQKSLMQHSIASSIPPTFDSEGLACVIKEKGYKKCLVFCGQKKPRILSLTDADIDLFPCYSSLDESEINFMQIKDENKLVILIHTLQSLRVLIKELPNNSMQRVSLVVPSKRIKEFSIDQGFKNCLLAESAHDQDMLDAALSLS